MTAKPLEPKLREIALVFGKTGMGKSNYIKTYLSELKRVIILDPLDEYPALEFTDMEELYNHVEPAKSDPKKTFCVKSCNILDLDVLGEIVADGDKKAEKNGYPIMKDVTFIIEEAQRCLPPSGKPIPDSLQRIIFLGRHFLRNLVIAAQRPSIVHIGARSQWTRIVSFNITEDADTGWIKTTSGYDILSEETDIRKLSVGDYFEITPGSFEKKHAPLYIPKRGKEERKESSIDNVFRLFASNT